MTPKLAVFLAGFVPAALGGIILGVRWYFRWLYNKLSTNGQVTQGTVVDTVTPSAREGVPHAMIEFVDTNNVLYSCETMGDREWEKFVGKQVTVAYDTNDPHRNVVLEEVVNLESMLGKPTPVVLLITGLVVMIGGVVLCFVDI